MPSNAARMRIDWTPGSAAHKALEIGEQLFPHLGRQAVIDKLIISGLHALRHVPPALWGHDRDAWELPAGLALQQPIPGNSGNSPRKRGAGFPGEVGERSGRGHAAPRNECSKP